MTILEYALPTIYYLPSGGALKCFLYVDSRVVDDDPSFAVPSSVNILSISPTVERVDLSAGSVDLDSMEVSIAEDFTDYTAGFWYNLIEGYPEYSIQIMFILTENSVDTYYYRGTLFRENVVWEEKYINSGDFIRSVKMQFVSPMLGLKSVSTTALVEYITVTNAAEMLVEGVSDALNVQSNYVTIANVMKSMIELAAGVEYDEGQFISVQGDILLNATLFGGDYNPFFDGYIAAQVYEEGSYVNTGFFRTSNFDPFFPMAWIKRYENCYQLFNDICASLGVIPHYYYGDVNGIYNGDATDKHTVVVSPRSNRASTKITNTKIISSSMVSNSTIKDVNVLVKDVDATNYWALNGIIQTGEVPQNSNFDIEITQIFSASTAYAQQQICFSYYGLTRRFGEADNTKYYNHNTSSWVTEAVTSANDLVRVLTSYLFYRFTKGRREYTREYGSLSFSNGTTSTHQNLKILARHDIVDGLSTTTYYATSVSKDIATNRATVIWIEE